VAIVQISQIKHRRGLRDDLPNPSLEEGELGLALDTGELFVGTPNLPVAAFRATNNIFPYANTQILTEWTDNVRNLLQYSYRNRRITFDPITAGFAQGNDFATPILSYSNGSQTNEIYVVRKLQERLDEMVSVKSYGARGDAQRDLTTLPSNTAMTAETYALRRAALDAVNVTNKTTTENEYQPKALHFPAGVYAVNDSILLPPLSTWIGEGKENTIISLVSSTNSLDHRHRCLFFTVDGLLQPEDAGSAAAIYEHSYTNIVDTFPLSGSTVLPHNIFVAGITFEINYNQSNNTNTPFDIGRLIRAKNVTFSDCKFKGNWSIMNETVSDFNNSPGIVRYFPGQPSVQSVVGINGDSIAMVIDSYAAMDHKYKPSNITFINCDFEDTTYAAVLTDDVSNISYINNTFNRHLKGVVVAEQENQPIPNNQITYGSAGPKHIKVTNSYFSNILREGIESNISDPAYLSALAKTDIEYIGGGVTSIGNRFDNVGNNSTNNGSLDFTALAVSPTTPIINFKPGSSLNASIGDTFGRSFVDELNKQPLLGPTLPIGGHNIKRVNYSRSDANIVLNSQDFVQKQLRKLSLTPGANLPIIVFDQQAANTIEINYVLVPNYITPPVSAKRRLGKFNIITNSEINGTAIFDEEYTEVGSAMGIQFNILVSGSVCTLRSSNSESETVIMYYNYEYNNSI